MLNKIAYFDNSTKEVEIREMTNEEKLELEETRLSFVSEQEIKTQEERAKATAKADLLEKLGITEEEAKLLLA